jgi:hypothetical protein
MQIFAFMGNWHVIRFSPPAPKRGVKMELRELEKKLAYLEFVNDQLMSEIRYVDELLRLVGFTNGLETVKAAAREMVDEGRDNLDIK